MKYLLPVIVIITLATGLTAQEIDDALSGLTPEVRRPGLPTVNIKTDNRFLMRAFYPEYYANEYKIRKDIRWLQRNDSALVTMWNSLGDSVLAMVEDFSGIQWQEKEFDINLVKYLRTDGLYDPLTIPHQGIKMEHYTEIAPSGLHQFLNLIKFAAGRGILQAELPGLSRQPASFHPLLEKSAYRFDVVVLTLTLACAEEILDPDSLENILNSEQWQRHNPGWELFDNHFRYSWILSPRQPLVMFLTREPYDSPLVRLTRPPRPRQPDSGKEQSTEPVRLSAGGGRLGFSVMKTATGLLEVADIDTLGLAYANGLMTGDRIKRVNGEIVRNARALMAKILDKIDTEGVYLLIVREGEELGLLFLPPSDDY